MKLKKILLIEDISCFGKCSVTVALPILSAAGFEVSVLPTAVFSTHTGISKEAAAVDFSEEMDRFIKHWEELKLDFDGILIGYAYGEAQVNKIAEYLRRKTDAVIVLDPAMAENGKLYSKLPENYVELMKSLCRHCDYITPNITEAFLLTDKPYHKAPYNRAEIMELLIILYGKFRKSAIITGIEFIDNRLEVMAINNNGDIYQYETKKLDRDYSGTGDMFAALFMDGLLKDRGFKTAIKDAMELTSKAVLMSTVGNYERLYFEGILKEL